MAPELSEHLNSVISLLMVMKFGHGPWWKKILPQMLFNQDHRLGSGSGEPNANGKARERIQGVVLDMSSKFPQNLQYL